MDASTGRYVTVDDPRFDLLGAFLFGVFAMGAVLYSFWRKYGQLP